MPKMKNLDKLKHPNSRKTNAMVKQIKKSKMREKSKQHNNIKMNLLGEKLLWFKEHLEASRTIYTPAQTIEIIEKYLGRFDEELEQICLKHSIGNRKNRQHASREDSIKMTTKNEQEEFQTCGFEIPNVLNSNQFKLLKEWNGELRFLPKFKLKRFSKKYLERLALSNDVKPIESDTKTEMEIV